MHDLLKNNVFLVKEHVGVVDDIDQIVEYESIVQAIGIDYADGEQQGQRRTVAPAEWLAVCGF